MPSRTAGSGLNLGGHNGNDLTVKQYIDKMLYKEQQLSPFSVYS
jgi:hypothetical protein